VTGVGPKAFRATKVEEALTGAKPAAALLAEAARATAAGVDALADIHASAEYRKEMSAVLARRALEQALERC
jgi:carbon-monoxide dehydrogenase medium subunit